MMLQFARTSPPLKDLFSKMTLQSSMDDCIIAYLPKLQSNHIAIGIVGTTTKVHSFCLHWFGTCQFDSHSCLLLPSTSKVKVTWFQAPNANMDLLVTLPCANIQEQFLGPLQALVADLDHDEVIAALLLHQMAQTNDPNQFMALWEKLLHDCRCAIVTIPSS